MKKFYAFVMMAMMAMSANAYDQATEGQEIYGTASAKAIGLADGTVAVYQFYTNGCFSNDTLYVPSTIQVWEGEGNDSHMTAEYEVSQVGTTWNPAIWVGEGETSNLAAVSTIVIAEGVKKIVQGAFTTWADADNLKTVHLPASLTNIGAGAFSGCTGLQKIVCLAETAPVLDNPGWTDHFKTNSETLGWDYIMKNCKVYVPSEAAKETYNQQGDNWSYWGEFYKNENVVVDATIIPTAISTVKEAKAANAAIYDLQGRRVAKAARGLYIQNGKKFVQK
jgi:hypothetical protein